MRQASGYARTAATGLPPRDAEAAAFAVVNRMLEAATAGGPARISALARNQQLWSLLLRDLALASNRLPPVLKQDLIALGTWSLRYSLRAMGRALPLDPLLAVNRDIAAALRGGDGPPRDDGPTRASAGPGLAVAL